MFSNMIAGYLFLAALIASVNSIPLRLEEELLLRNIMTRASQDPIGCKSDEGEVLYLFDGSDTAQLESDVKFAAESSLYLSKDVTIEAAVYTDTVGAEKTFAFADAYNGLEGMAEGVSGGDSRNVVAAVQKAGEMSGSGTKIAVIFVNGESSNLEDAVKEAKKVNKNIIVYVVVPKKDFNTLEPLVSDIATYNVDRSNVLPSSRMFIAENFQLDLNVEYFCK